MKFHVLAPLVTLLSGVAAAVLTTNTTTLCNNTATAQKRRLFVLTDIGNEPDDQMSLVRLLLYSNEIEVEGLAAVTSTWLKNVTNAATIKSIITAYGEVVDNLNANVDAYSMYPSASDLLSKVSSGHPVYGLAALKLNMSEAANSLVRTVDEGSTSNPLYIAGWGGTNVLAEALSFVSASRNDTEVQEFVSKVRYYGASDQDDAAFWVRTRYPELFFVSSIHGWGQYYEATWAGISGESVWLFDPKGPNSTLVTNDWLQSHIRLGRLGAQYPNFTAIMEGDTPTFFPMIQNGLGDPEHPEWGSWGGRYTLVEPSGKYKLYSNAVDFALGTNGEYFTSAFASIWRWREAYQFDFANRIQWSMNGNYSQNNHNPIPVVNGTCGTNALIIPFTLGESVILDGSSSWDPDGDQLSFEWFNYQEVSMGDLLFELPGTNFWLDSEILDDQGAVISATPKSAVAMHMILKVTDHRDISATSYRRVILTPHSD